MGTTAAAHGGAGRRAALTAGGPGPGRQDEVHGEPDQQCPQPLPAESDEAVIAGHLQRPEQRHPHTNTLPRLARCALPCWDYAVRVPERRTVVHIGQCAVAAPEGGW